MIPENGSFVNTFEADAMGGPAGLELGVARHKLIRATRGVFVRMDT